jgi:hypothetical protein
MISKFIERFFKRVEETPIIPPTEDELVDGKAFRIRHYPLDRPIPVDPTSIIQGSVYEGNELILQKTERVGVSMTVNTISMVRFNDSLGYKNAVGVIFGER